MLILSVSDSNGSKSGSQHFYACVFDGHVAVDVKCGQYSLFWPTIAKQSLSSLSPTFLPSFSVATSTLPVLSNTKVNPVSRTPLGLCTLARSVLGMLIKSCGNQRPGH